MKVLVSPYSAVAHRHIGIGQSDDGQVLMAFTLCCGAQLGWRSFVGAGGREGMWTCNTCTRTVLAMSDYTADGFGEYARSTMVVFMPRRTGSPVGEWANIKDVKAWAAAWLKVNPELVDVDFEMVETP